MNIQKSANRRVGGFTLIELLVVIAIIALLIAILLPSLEAARRQAKMSACLSHIKNIASSSRVYEADDPQGWGIPVHPAQYKQNASNPTFIGATNGAERAGSAARASPTTVGSSEASMARSRASDRPRAMNRILYPGGFPGSRRPATAPAAPRTPSWSWRFLSARATTVRRVAPLQGLDR